MHVSIFAKILPNDFSHALIGSDYCSFADCGGPFFVWKLISTRIIMLNCRWTVITTVSLNLDQCLDEFSCELMDRCRFLIFSPWFLLSFGYDCWIRDVMLQCFWMTVVETKAAALKNLLRQIGLWKALTELTWSKRMLKINVQEQYPVLIFLSLQLEMALCW